MSARTASPVSLASAITLAACALASASCFWYSASVRSASILASSDFFKASLIVFSRLTSMPSKMGQPNFARMIHKMMKATSIGMNSFIFGRMASIPPPSSANAYAGTAIARAVAAAKTALNFAALFVHFNSLASYSLISESLDKTYRRDLSDEEQDQAEQG